MLDFLFSFCFLIFGCTIGTYLGNLLSNYIMYKGLKKNNFSKSDFDDIDNDFFGDDNDKSITDIDINNNNNINFCQWRKVIKAKRLCTFRN